jgi:hypothetical protein
MSKTFTLNFGHDRSSHKVVSFTCLLCGHTSYDEAEVQECFCKHCHHYHVRTCLYCDEQINKGAEFRTIPHLGENGSSTEQVHEECFVRMFAGSAAHQRRQCSCFGGSDHEERGLSRRESALKAYAVFKERMP